jgi:hypothetical protein
MKMAKNSGPRWETYAIISLYPVGKRTFDPRQVTSILGIKPARSWRRGDVMKPSGRKRAYDGWEFKSKQSTSREPGRHVTEVIDAVWPRWKILKQNIPGLACTVDIVIYILTRSMPPIVISRASAKRAADLNAKIGIDMYMIPEPSIGDEGECEICGTEIGRQ